jgi:hypothetical protein
MERHLEVIQIARLFIFLPLFLSHQINALDKIGTKNIIFNQMINSLPFRRPKLLERYNLPSSNPDPETAEFSPHRLNLVH